MEVLSVGDAQVVLEVADQLLRADPVATNLVATLLINRAASGDPGRYWVVDPSSPAGVALQSPLDFPLVLTPMPGPAVDALVDTIVGDSTPLSGVTGEAATAARFAGAWAERTRTAAVPFMGERLYEAASVVEPTGVLGCFRAADVDDRDALIRFVTGFGEATGERTDAVAMVDARLPRGHLWVWDDDGPVSMAALSVPAHGVVRVQAVFTPDEHRGRGYVSACVATITQRSLAAGHRCVLFTDLGNPTSNAIYRSIGYRAVSEILCYRLG